MSGEYIIHPPFRAVLQLHRLPMAETAVMCAYALRASADGTGAYPSLDEVAECVGSTRQAVTRVRDRLLEAGVLRPCRHGRGYEIEMETPVDLLSDRPKRGHGLARRPQLRVAPMQLRVAATPSCNDATPSSGPRNSELHEVTHKEPKKEPSRRKPEVHPDARRLCELLAELMVANGSRPPNVGDGWITDMDRLLRLDGIEPVRVERCIRWCQRDDFWKGNILSPKKLREKFDQLRLAAQRERPKISAVPSEHAAYEGDEGRQHSRTLDDDDPYARANPPAWNAS